MMIVSTGGYYTYQSESTAITNAAGVHDLYLVGQGTYGVASIDYFSFTRFVAAPIGRRRTTPQAPPDS